MRNEVKSVGPIALANSVFVVAEFRGAKVEEIRWRDKKTGQDQQMHKYNLALELENGTQVSGTQMGRDFSGEFDLKKGAHYVFIIGRYFVEKGRYDAQVLDIGSLESLASLDVFRDASKPLDIVKPEPAASAAAKPKAS